MKDRVRQVQDHYNLTQKSFANELCVAEATISSIYRGRTAPTNNLIQAIHQAYPAINVNWLMFGEGDMLLPLSAGTANAGSAGEAAGTSSSMSGMSGSASGTSGAAYGSAGANAVNAGVGQNVGNWGLDGPSLFDAPAGVIGGKSGAKPEQNRMGYPEFSIAEVVSELKKANQVDKVERKIKEIRVFYDDGTYEAFAPCSK